MTHSADNRQILVYSTSWCPDCHRAKHVMDEYGVAYVEHDIERDEAAMAFVKKVNQGKRVVPTIVFPDGSILVEPSTSVLAEKLGIEL